MKILFVHGGEKPTKRQQLQIDWYRKTGYEVTVERLDPGEDGLRPTMVIVDEWTYWKARFAEMRKQ